MTLKFILSAAVITGAAFTSLAQTHAEGEEYYKADQFVNAKELLLRNMNNPGTDKSISDYYLGLIAQRNGDIAEAQKLFTSGTQANAENPFNYVGLGGLELKAGNKGAAEKLFKEAESKVKKSVPLQIAIARAYYNADPVAYEKEIEKRLEKARKINIKDVDIYLFEGDRKKDKKDYGGAAGQYEMGANYNADAAEAYVKYANLFTQVNQQFAIDMLSKLLQQNPNSALAQRELANAYYNAGQFEKAAEQYANYIKNPNHFKSDENRFAFLLFYGGDYQKGYDYSTSLLQADPKNFTAQRYQFMNAAQIESMRPQLLQMAEALYATHKQDPANKFAPIDYILIASELNDAKRPEEAIAVFKEAIAETPENPEFYKQLAMTYVNGNNLSEAANTYLGYLEHSEKPGYNDFIQQATFAFYAGVENQAKDADAATKYFNMCNEYADKAAEILPNHHKPKKFKGDIAKQTATPEQAASVAVPAYLECITLLEASENPERYKNDARELYNYVGNYYLDQKDVEKAKQYFNKYLQYDPNNEQYRKFVEGLK